MRALLSSLPLMMSFRKGDLPASAVLISLKELLMPVSASCMPSAPTLPSSSSFSDPVATTARYIVTIPAADLAGEQISEAALVEHAIRPHLTVQQQL